MITFTVLLIAVIAFIIVGVFALLTAGGATTIVLGDLLVFALLVFGLVKLFRKLKR